MAGYNFTEQGAKRIVKAVRTVEGTPLVVGSRYRSPVETSRPADRFMVVTTENCCVDQYSLDYEAQYDSDQSRAKYVEGKFINRLTGAVIEGDSPGYASGDPIRIYPSRAMTGFLAKGTEVNCRSTRGGYLAIGTATCEADAYATSLISNEDESFAILYPDDPEQGVIRVEDVVIQPECGVVVTGTRFIAQWKYDPVLESSRLVVARPCCEPAEVAV